ncbi:MAG: hypothetical protein K0M64_02610 [Rhizobium sp.]|nr:hypothetical protein [Rhizobium sp.]
MSNLPYIPFTALALVPLEGEAPAEPVTGRARFSCNTRDGGDRRKGEDRREQVRFQSERRQQRDRRPAARKPWEQGTL